MAPAEMWGAGGRGVAERGALGGPRRSPMSSGLSHLCPQTHDGRIHLHWELQQSRMAFQDLPVLQGGEAGRWRYDPSGRVQGLCAQQGDRPSPPAAGGPSPWWDTQDRRLSVAHGVSHKLSHKVPVAAAAALPGIRWGPSLCDLQL